MPYEVCYRALLSIPVVEGLKPHCHTHTSHATLRRAPARRGIGSVRRTIRARSRVELGEFSIARFGLAVSSNNQESRLSLTGEGGGARIAHASVRCSALGEIARAPLTHGLADVQGHHLRSGGRRA